MHTQTTSRQTEPPGIGHIFLESEQKLAIQNTLLSIGFHPNLLGFQYICTALDLILKNPDYLYGVTKSLYIDLASHYHTTPSRVERSIRHSIHKAWENGNIPYINYVFRIKAVSCPKAPSNSLFLAQVYCFLSERRTA